MAKQRNATDVTVKKLLIHTASKDYNLEPHLLELNIYEDFLNQNDQDLYQWVSGQRPCAPQFIALVRDIKAHISQVHG